MTKLKFCRFMDYEDGKIARMETESGIPVNIFADDGSDFGISEGTACSLKVWGMCSDMEIYKSEDEFYDSVDTFAAEALIPCGTFSIDPDDKDFRQSPDVIVTGKVLEIEENKEALPDEPNWFFKVETIDMILNLFSVYEGTIEVGNTICGTAWLYADIV